MSSWTAVGAGSTGALGADAAALDDVAARFGSAAATLAARPRWHRAGVLGDWSGPDAAGLAAALDAAARERERAAVALQRCGRLLVQAASQQRRASLAGPSVAVPVDRSGGGGRLVQRVGGARASVVVLLVPGVGTDRGDRTRLRADALRVWRELAERVDDPSLLAVVSWLGYDPPDRVLGALDVTPAEEGAAELRRTVADLRRHGAERVTVVGHSYGGVVVGRAAANGMDADVVVELGSPGVGRPGAVAAIAAAGIDLRAIRVPEDPIGFVVDRLPGLYGEDAVGEAAGLASSGRGHSSYLSDPVLLDALADLAVAGVAHSRGITDPTAGGGSG